MTDSKRRIVVGISGASGIIYGVRALEMLRDLDIETHLVMTKSAQLAVAYELNRKVSDVKKLASVVHDPANIGAAISSGSFQTDGMIVAPCSVKSLSEIASGITGGLLSRAADVTLKERRPLILMVRETPLHLGHLRSMAQVYEIGGIIMPPVPAFYAMPKTIEEMVDHTVGRMLDLLKIDSGTVKRWGE
ncbi:UbiX family flavin prenyltransferase [Acinetobacter baumannii]|uniref:UbiX family flavin prenyltransferase n=1 Tax=Acinetobacter baumannii TaxID=470 RepID=UPI0023405797|nr:UbiX family flavin prenyltransferase [Acinetobacter baumannii]MDC4414434.1 UbiX family flavin prenyltransferase [Acinetobacter baumannii]MDH2520311.1 UbiX family flavin prenyltransferase [Acinetobacter baumannii]MDK2200814.1 UbiX family flavin prenyltransferase [Acinetobacter baumannii]